MSRLAKVSRCNRLYTDPCGGEDCETCRPNTAQAYVDKLNTPEPSALWQHMHDVHDLDLTEDEEAAIWKVTHADMDEQLRKAWAECVRLRRELHEVKERK